MNPTDAFFKCALCVFGAIDNSSDSAMNCTHDFNYTACTKDEYNVTFICEQSSINYEGT